VAGSQSNENDKASEAHQSHVAVICPIAKEGVMPLETASDEVSAPKTNISPAPVEAAPIEK